MLLPRVLPFAALAAAVSISEINGSKYLSPLNGTTLKAIEGLVTAKAENGVYLQSTQPDDDERTSEGIYLYDRAFTARVEVGDVIEVDATVQEYRSNDLYVYLTELTNPDNLRIVSSGGKVKAKVIGKDTGPPPTEQFSALDEGDIFAVPNDQRRISEANPTLQPDKYGMDFWESLVGEMVTVEKAVAVARPNQYGDVWVRGHWKATGVNKHGGLTMLEGDANPEAIVIGSPLDGTSNPDDLKLGDAIGDVTGVVTYAFGFYRILPVSAISASKLASTDVAATTLVSDGSCKGITVASYNARNLYADAPHMAAVARQIVDKLLLPDIIMLQEIQDNNGPVNDGTTSANVTLANLAAEIAERSGGGDVLYEGVEVEPADNQDGGEPGGNIRQAYLYRPDRVSLYEPNQAASDESVAVVADAGWPSLTYNPGRIDVGDAAWSNSRKPLIAQWKPARGTGKTFFTVNVHFGSKGGSSSLHGDPRPPVNKGVEKREQQAVVTADFIRQILAADPRARIVTAGDFNEFTQVRPLQTFMEAGAMRELDEVVGIPAEERYTYLYDMNCQQLDHMFISEGLVKNAQFEHLHLNSWQTYDDQVSDHDPSVAKLNVCGC